MAKKFPIHPVHPERNCWGCDKYCAADSLACGNGSERTQHPAEVFGEDWLEWGLDAASNKAASGDDIDQGGSLVAAASPDRAPARHCET